MCHLFGGGGRSCNGETLREKGGPFLTLSTMRQAAWFGLTFPLSWSASSTVHRHGASHPCTQTSETRSPNHCFLPQNCFRSLSQWHESNMDRKRPFLYPWEPPEPLSDKQLCQSLHRVLSPCLITTIFRVAMFSSVAIPEKSATRRKAC